MRHRPAEADQLMLAMEGCVLSLSKKLRDLGIRNFEELYRFGIQKESDLAQEKKFFTRRPGSKEASSSSSNVQINAIRQARRFSNLGRPLSKVLERLMENHLLQPLPLKQPLPNTNPKLYCKFHQAIGHDTDNYTRLRYKVQNLIDSGKITDPETRKPNT